MKKVYDPEEVLKAMITYYANTDCKNFNASVTAKFVQDEDGEIDGSVELVIENKKSNKSDKTNKEMN